MESSAKRVESVHYLRGLAAMMVVFHHSLIQVNAYMEVPPRTDLGSFGVDVFFIISGFVIWMATRNSTKSASIFLYKRFIRVVPFYWMTTSALMLVFLLNSDLFRTTNLQIEHFIKSLLFIPHYNPGHPGEVWPLLIPGWTLNYEMFFYATFGLMMLIFRTRLLLVLTLVFFSLVGFGLLSSSHNAVMKTYTSDYLLEFWFGAILANLYLLGKLSFRHPWHGLIIFIAAIVLAALSESYKFHNISPGVFWGLPAVLLVAGALMIEQSVEFKRNRMLHLLGDASYSIYLTHLFTLGAARALWGDVITIESEPIQKWLFVSAGLLLSAAFGIVIHILLEKPMLEWMRRWRPGVFLPGPQTGIR